LQQNHTFQEQDSFCGFCLTGYFARDYSRSKHWRK